MVLFPGMGTGFVFPVSSSTMPPLYFTSLQLSKGRSPKIIFTPLSTCTLCSSLQRLICVNGASLLFGFHGEPRWKMEGGGLFLSCNVTSHGSCPWVLRHRHRCLKVVGWDSFFLLWALPSRMCSKFCCYKYQDGMLCPERSLWWWLLYFCMSQNHKEELIITDFCPCPWNLGSGLLWWGWHVCDSNKFLESADSADVRSHIRIN